MGIRGSPKFPAVLVITLGVWSTLFLVFLILAPAGHGGVDEDAALAVRLMSRSVEAIRAGRLAAGVPIDPRTDLNRTGLVGIENSPITTSLGQIEAKRTAANPQFAAAVARMLREAGVRRGDTVALSASSSFPGLIVAALCAAQSMDLRILPILSLGASNWGGNDPRWTGLETIACLNRGGILDVPLLAASVGGAGDVGGDMTAEGRVYLKRKILEAGLLLIEEKTLADDVRLRMGLFESHAGGSAIKAFINVGGSWVNMGVDPEVLKLKPGFNPAASVFVPPAGRRGLIQEMAARGVPVIHLLYVKGLADRYGLPWDPFPLPVSDPSASREGKGPARPLRIGGAAVYLLGVIGGAALIHRRRRSLTG
jgi:poly-gamma-glutamate system protein